MVAVDVIILHPGAAAGPSRAAAVDPTTGPGAPRLSRALADARATLAEHHRRGFLAAGAATARIVTDPPDGVPFGARLRAVLAEVPVGRGLVLLGSGAIPLATAADRRAFLAAAALAGRRALSNNRYSSDVLAMTADAAATLRAVPPEFPTDNALPRWLEEPAGATVTDLRSRWRLGVDLDSPLDLLLVASADGCPPAVRRLVGSWAGSPGDAARDLAGDPLGDLHLLPSRLAAVRVVLADSRAELIVAGRTSAATLGWLEHNARCRVRAFVEERGLRASSRLAQAAEGTRDPAGEQHPPRPQRPPRSVLGTLLDRDGPAALGARLAELGDAALIDTRVLLAHRLGVDESAWPSPEDRFASDLLLAHEVHDPWLATLTASAAQAPIPVMLGGHSLVGPGVRLVARQPAR